MGNKRLREAFFLSPDLAVYKYGKGDRISSAGSKDTAKNSSGYTASKDNTKNSSGAFKTIQKYMEAASGLGQKEGDCEMADKSTELLAEGHSGLHREPNTRVLCPREGRGTSSYPTQKCGLG